MSPRTLDKLAIGSWYIGVGAFAVTVVLFVVMLVRFPELSPFSSWIGSEPEITVTSAPEITVTGEYDDITFLEMEKLLLSTEEMTNLQAEGLTHRWSGRRVIWDGFITNVGGSSSVIVVSMEPRPNPYNDLGINYVWAQAHFDRSHEGVLSLLRKKQAVRVSCEFDKLFLWNNPVLVDCHLVEIEGLIGPPAPSCDDNDINCHPETAPNLEGTVS